MHRLNLTLPGMGGGQKRQKVEPKPMVKKRYWTPTSDDWEKGVQYGTPTAPAQGSTTHGPAQYPAGSGYTAGDPWYDGKVWDKKTQQWIKQTDDIYRTNDAGETLMWQPPKEPRKKGLLK